MRTVAFSTTQAARSPDAPLGLDATDVDADLFAYRMSVDFDTSLDGGLDADNTALRSQAGYPMGAKLMLGLG